MRAGKLEIAFDSKEIRSICESESRAKRKFGTLAANGLKHRLADIRAAISITDLVVGRLRLLNDGTEQRMVIDLGDGYQIVFCANHPQNPIAASGKLDWLKVSRIKIIGIESGL